MKWFVLAVTLTGITAFAQDAGVEDAGVEAVMDAGVVAVVVPVVPLKSLSIDAGTVDVPIEVEASVSMAKTVFVAVKSGDWWLAAGALLVLVVSLLRTAGRKFHDWLPDDNILDKPLIFLYDTKIGGWILNWLTAIAGGFGTAMAAGVAVDMSLWKSVLIVSTSASALFELWKDVSEWWKNRKAVPAAAAVPVPVEPPKP